jgi:hypothetical protein
VVLACAVALTMSMLPPASAIASPEGAGKPASEAGKADDQGAKKRSKLPGTGDAGSAEEAAESGDLTTARERATAAREADRSAESWLREAHVLEQAGDYSGAISAYKAHLAALPEGASDQDRAGVEAKIRALEERSRGAVEDEPESTHRERLDQERADRIAAARPKPKPRPLQPREPKDDKITRKWYFWVTLAAIAASGAAITAIAIKAATEDQPDALDTQSSPVPSGPALLRF